jgi:hypothetical protein
MADSTPCHFNRRLRTPSSSSNVTIAQMIKYIIICIYMQKLTSTDRYSLSYDSAKFNTAMANFDAILRQAITLSISDCFLQFIHINVDLYIIYHRISRGDNMTTK